MSIEKASKIVENAGHTNARFVGWLDFDGGHKLPWFKLQNGDCAVVRPNETVRVWSVEAL